MKLVKKSFGLGFVGHSTGVQMCAWALWRVANPALTPEFAGRVDGAPSTPDVLISTFDFSRDGSQPEPREPFGELGVTFGLDAPRGEPFGRWRPDTPEEILGWKAMVRDERAGALPTVVRSLSGRLRFERTLAKVGE